MSLTLVAVISMCLFAFGAAALLLLWEIKDWRFVSLIALAALGAIAIPTYPMFREDFDLTGRQEWNIEGVVAAFFALMVVVFLEHYKKLHDEMDEIRKQQRTDWKSDEAQAEQI